MTSRGSKSNGRRISNNVRVKVGTANVPTLDPRAERQLKKSGLAWTGKSQALEHLFHSAGYDIIGIQESSLQGDGDSNGCHFRKLRAGANAKGSGGVQPWLSLGSNPVVHAVAPT